MSHSVDFIFGNVDKQGKLEKDDQVAADLRELLSSEETAKYLNNVLSTSVPDLDSKPSETSLKDESDIKVEPLKDAQDYMDITEMAEDLAPKPLAMAPTFFKPSPQLTLSSDSSSKHLEMPKITGRLKFSEVFASRVAGIPISFRTKNIPVIKDDAYDVGMSDVDIFQRPLNRRYQLSTNTLDSKKSEAIKKVPSNIPVKAAFGSDLVLSSLLLEHWEDKVLWEEAAVTEKHTSFIKQDTQIMFRNHHLDDDEWVKAVNWGDNDPSFSKLHLQDPTLLILEEEAHQIENFKPENMLVYNFKKRPDGKLIDRFNISEDWKSEAANSKLRIKQTHGPVKLMHSLPSCKPLLPVKEMRSHHRLGLKFPLNESIKFSRVKAVKKKKFSENLGEVMRTPKDITLKDTSKFVLVEYSEEYPPIIQNVGMASLIHNYYRKKDEKDNFVPKLANGGAFILDAVDVSPFFDFGDVLPGETSQVLYNNIFRAPLFPQPKPTHDFLMIRQTFKGVTKYFIQDIPNIYVVGQTYPVEEVPRPQARKITQALKSRLQVVGYRMMRQDPLRRLNYSRLRAQFPMFTDLQIRQKLKEFAVYFKKGENTGWWKLKAGMLLPDEDGIRKIWTPEMVCLQHSTLVGAQRLKDAGYGAEDLKEVEGDEENESHLDIEVQLAPWTTTKNFIAAAAGKGMVQLFGPGDPTGCGEGFSYIRASMKEMFFKNAEGSEQSKTGDGKSKQSYHKYSIMEQQKVYRAEILRIFNNQKKSLGKYLSMNSAQEKSELEKIKSRKLEAEKTEERERQGQMGYSNANSPAVFSPPAFEHEDDNEDTHSSAHGSALAGKSKMLVINRLVLGNSGDPVWKSEVITDPRVLNAYLRHRKMIEAPTTASSLYPNETDVRARIQRRTYAHLVKLQIKQGKRPPLTQEEDLSESELPDETVQKPAVPNLKIATVTGQSGDPLFLGKKRINPLDLTEADVSRRKGSPEYDLAEGLGKILSRFSENPEYAPFLELLPRDEFPAYYTHIKNPLCLRDVQERITNFRYRSKQRFLEDINLISANCKSYNGEGHLLTSAANELVYRINALVQLDTDILNRYEVAIVSKDPEDLLTVDIPQ